MAEGQVEEGQVSGREEEESEKRAQLDEYFEGLIAKLKSEEAKDNVSGLSIVASVLEKEIPCFLGALQEKEIAELVLEACDRLLALEDVGASVKALRCLGEVARHTDGPTPAHVERIVGSYLGLCATVFEKGAGGSPGKGSPKKGGAGDLAQGYANFTESLSRIFHTRSLTTSELVVLSPELCDKLQAALQGAREKESSALKAGILEFLCSATLRFPSGPSFEAALRATLGMVADPFGAYADAKGAEEAGTTEAFEFTEEHARALAAAAALVRNNAPLLTPDAASQSMAALAALNSGLFEDFVGAGTKEGSSSPQLAGGDLGLALLECSGAAAAEDLVRACLGSKLPAVLGGRIRLLVQVPERAGDKGAEEAGSPKKQAEPERLEANQVSQKEAAAAVALAGRLLDLAAQEDRQEVYLALARATEPPRAAAPEPEPEEAAGGGEGEEGEAAAEGEAAPEAKEGVEEAGAGSGDEGAEDAKPEEDDAEGEPAGDSLVSALFAISSGDLNFEAVRSVGEEEGGEEEEEPGAAPEQAPEEEGKSPGSAPGAEDEGGEAKEGGEEAERAAAKPQDAPPEARPVDFILQDSAARVLYTLATAGGAMGHHLGSFCVPSTLVKMVEAGGNRLPQAVLHKLLLVLLYTEADSQKTRWALEEAARRLAAGGHPGPNVSTDMCVVSSFKVGLEGLLPTKCPPEPSPPPTPPPPPLATNKFLWDALGRPDIVDGGNLPTLRAIRADKA